MIVTEVQGGQVPSAAPSAEPGPAPAASSKFKAVAPVAAGGLAIVAAITAGSMFAGNSAKQSIPENPAIVGEATPVAPSSSMSGSTMSSAPASEPGPAPLPIDPAANPPPMSSPMTAAPAPPKPGSAIPGVAFDQAPPAGVTQSMEIVVKFKDDEKVKEIVDAFWKDKASAAAKFDALKARRPEFANLKLDRVTYSNELVLVHDGKTPAIQLGAMRDLAAKLGKSADISYAEPNLTAHPGKQ